ncbi:uncharacterized protein LOC125071430 [Vanessa atalanta]|uniref:uncharacterized protein LOC125071430 n=1 Tax=Vanessa atalanta TaxID=42275 RepID=UPI001FCD70D3|nr:uncharacterized protein LOC125071430 [Vanessa atalanta]
MKVLAITLFSTLIIIASQAKLIAKEKGKQNMNESYELKREKLSRQERILRDFFNSYNSKIRRPREFTKKSKEPDNITEIKSTINPKVALVKKPLPKFTDADTSEEDYQLKMKYPVKYFDSMEHEDEDFNLDDYDFDIHHDEFAGRGKPLEPRTKIKLTERRTGLESIKEGVERPKSPLSQNKVVMPRKINHASNKVVRKAVQVIKIDDYDDDFSTSTGAPRKETKPSDDDMSNENEDSKEYESQGSVRTVRSPAIFSNYFEKFNERSTAFMSKILSYLPIFPQVPPPKN